MAKNRPTRKPYVPHKPKKAPSQTEIKPAEPVISQVPYYYKALPDLGNWIGIAGYGALMVDHYGLKFTKPQRHLLPCPDFIDSTVFYHQGADFFSAPVYSILFGQIAMLKAHDLVNAISKEKSAAFRENWRSIRSGITMGMFALYEGVQSVALNKPYDLQDMVAYGCGMAALMHPQDIFRETVKSVAVIRNQTQKTIRSVLGLREDKLT